MNESAYLKTLSENILNLRKSSGLTQENLAERLNISFQAVSKWENEQSSPDIALLPALAEIFGVSIDRLFGRNAEAGGLAPWDDDDKLRGIIFRGRNILETCNNPEKFIFTFKGEALNVESNCTVTCGDVAGNVTAGVDVNCGDVNGSVEAGVNVNCGNIAGGVNAGVSISCGDVGGEANAGVSVNCQSC
ncbi:MAG: helix-turn-helix domain-containing protein [Oscillospiraceae bacterium]|nr:helix-turn-helix domain-containing protein [Oscillospiraceae bacterium]